MLKFIGLVPHPPLIIPGVSRSEAERSRVERTIAAMEQLARRVHGAKTERLIVITPHGPLLREGIAAAAPPLLEGDFSRFGAAYDRMLLELLREGRLEDILGLDEDLVEAAGECALRSFVIALGALPGRDFRTEVLSYEGPFGGPGDPSPWPTCLGF